MSHPVLLRVQLLGGFSLVYDNASITGVHSARLQSLLAYLLLRADAPQSRPHLSFLLWPDSTETSARNNLRQLMYQLRQALPDPDRFLLADTNTVCWKTDEGQSIDVVLFERALKESEVAEKRGDVKESHYKLDKAVAQYAGDLLPGCYDDWIAPERERLRQRCISACQKLIPALEAQREYAAALQMAQRVSQFDLLDEDAYLSLIRLHGLNNDLSGARRVYQSATELLQRELNAEPSDELRDAYHRSQHRTPRTTSFIEADSSKSAFSLVGRREEWQKLQAAWQRATEGPALLGLITGEPGIGKSRLAEELFNWVTLQGYSSSRTRSYGMEGRLSLAPITEWLRSKTIRPHLSSLDPVWLTEIARLLPELLTEDTNLARPEPIHEYGRRQRFFEALARGVLAGSEPLLLWIDDLQWCDQETLEWLHFLLRFEPRPRLLILGTARNDEAPPDHPLYALTRQLQREDQVALIELNQFDAAETAKLASQVHGHALDDSAVVRLYRETEGNPLFVVEAVRAGMIAAIPPEKNGTLAAKPAAPPNLPPRVQAVIAGRLAQLSPPARAVAEIGAAIGRAFPLELLLLASSDTEESVIQALNELWLRRIVREQSASVFDFTHDKLREVAAAETSLPQRRMLHRRIAQALEKLHESDLDPISAQIATHYEQAGHFDQAIPYYEKAGSLAASVYANEDAIHLYNRGLDLLKRCAASVKRDSQELNIQLELATLYRISKGWASAEEERVMHRVMVLSDKVGTVNQRIRSLFGLLALYVVQAQYEKVERTYAELQKLFRTMHGTPPPFAEIYLAGARLLVGQPNEARVMFEQTLATRNEKHISDLQETQGLNYVAHAFAWNAHALWCLGYPKAAHDNVQRAIELAHESAQPFNQALAITYRAMLRAWSVDASDFLIDAEDACRASLENKAPYYHAWASMQLRFAQAIRQPDSENLARLRKAIQTFIETGARVRLPVYYSMLAEACLKSGQLEEGLEALELALAESIQNNEHWWDAEIHRLRGELMFAQGAASSDIEAAFLRALEIAQAQQAKSLELRAAASLARFSQVSFCTSEAKHRLANVVEWFDEGFETADLRSAKALLVQL